MSSPIGKTVKESIQARRRKSDAYRAEYDRLEVSAQIAREVMFARQDLDLTQAALAKKVGTTASAISRIESGQHLPSLRTLAKLATALNLNLSIELKQAKQPKPKRQQTQRRAARRPAVAA